MAKYSKGAQKKVKRAMHEKKKGTLKSGRSGKKVTSRKQAIAIGLSEARKSGAKVPKKKSTSKRNENKIIKPRLRGFIYISWVKIIVQKILHNSSVYYKEFFYQYSILLLLFSY